MRLPAGKGRMATSAVFVALLAGSGVLASYPIGPSGKLPGELATGRATSYQFSGAYSWRPPVATDGSGRLLADHPLLADDAAFPYAIERMLDLGGGEPTIGVTSSGNLFVVTFDQVQRSPDQGRSWEVVHSFVTPNFPTTVDRFRSFDPMLWVDPDTDRVFVNHLTIFIAPLVGVVTWCTALIYSDDEGESWSAPVQIPGSGLEVPDTTCDVPVLVDHQKIITAHKGPDALLDPAAAPLSLLPNSYPNVFYFCNNRHTLRGTLSTWCAVSYDGGATFPYTRSVRVPEAADLVQAAGLSGFLDMPGCPGINGHPAPYPDGTVVVPLCGGSGAKSHGQPIVGVTTDNGVQWTIQEFEGDVGQVEIDPDITVTPDGTAYLLFRGSDQLAYLLRSRDKFDTWEGPFRVSPPDHTLDAFTALTSGSDGRLVLTYLGTRDNQSDERNDALPEGQRRAPEPSFAKRGTRWHLFVTTSLDANAESPTFVTQQVSPEEDPVQVGCIWMYGGGSGCRNLLDFIDVTRDSDGRFYVAFTDGCTPRNGCTTDPDAATFQSTDREVAVAIQDRGASLFADHSLLPSLALEPPVAIPR